MESIEKYKAHLIKNLANKESKYLPSISSISDLSINGINNKWSSRWNNELQIGAEIPHENDQSENKSEPTEVKTNNKEKENNKSNDRPSIVDNLKEESVKGSHKEYSKREFEDLRAKLSEEYRDNYQKKYEKYKYIFENREEANAPLGTERIGKEALNGLGFWATYRKVLETAYNKDNNNEDLEQHQAEDELSGKDKALKHSDNILDSSNSLGIEKNFNSPKCCTNSIGEGKCVSCSSKPLHILVTRSKSGKVTDKLSVNLNNKGVNKPLLRSINITVKSKKPRKMVTFNDQNSFGFDDDFSPLKIEPTFGSRQTSYEKYSTLKPKRFEQSHNEFGFVESQRPLKSDGYHVPNFGVSQHSFGEDKNGFGKEYKFTNYTKSNLNSNSYPVSSDYSYSLVSNDQGSFYGNKGLVVDYGSSLDNEGKLEVNGSDCNSSDSGKTQSKHCGHSYTNNTNNNTSNNSSRNDKQDKEKDNTNSNGDVCCSFDGESFTNSGGYSSEQESMSQDLGSFEEHVLPQMRTINYYGDGYSDNWSDDVVNLLTGDVKLHAFKVNNKSVNVPLFLNVGNNQSVYSGQAFVSNTNIGLFKISVVDPVEPKVSLGNKISSLIGMNNYNSPACKCTNLDVTKTIKNAVQSPSEVFNGLLNTLSEQKGVQWMNLKNKKNNMKMNTTINSTGASGPTIVSKGSGDDSTATAEPKVCDFHKNLFSHKVDRTKFGKDVFCQLKYMNSISSDSPIKVSKNNFTTGSNVSSFFNGFYEQLLCLGDTTQMSKRELQSNHKFTFIIRRVKGSKYGKNFVIINTTSGQHLCIDLLTHELKFEEECKFSKYLVPAIFKIIALPTLVDSISKDLFNTFKPVVGSHCGYPDRYYYAGVNGSQVHHMLRSPTHMSTTDQYVNVT